MWIEDGGNKIFVFDDKPDLVTFFQFRITSGNTSNGVWRGTASYCWIAYYQDGDGINFGHGIILLVLL